MILCFRKECEYYHAGDPPKGWMDEGYCPIHTAKFEPVYTKRSKQMGKDYCEDQYGTLLKRVNNKWRVV